MNSYYNQSLLFPQCVAQSVGPANQMFIQLIHTLMVAHCTIPQAGIWPKDYGPNVKNHDEYDFIVVGAGSAGSVVANRLSENPNWNVLLVEYGGDPPFESEVSGMHSSLVNTKYDWQFTAASDKTCKNKNGRCEWPRGKMLGGSSAMNMMIYARGNPQDYDNWAAMGNSGWDYESVLPFFKKSEHNRFSPFVYDHNGRYHSDKGLLNIDFYGSSPFQRIFIDAAIEDGYKFVSDINADEYIGYTIMQGTSYQGRRQSTAKAFLATAKDRKNLHIIKYSLVKEILIDENKRAYGIRYERKGKTLDAYAKREVILSAGAIMSPVVLMLSGIGPKDHLKQHKIEVKRDLPVGQNLLDHVIATLNFQFDPTPKDPNTDLDNIFNLAIHNTGALTNIGTRSLMAFTNTDKNAKFPNIQMNFGYEQQNSQHKNDAGSVTIILLNPKSTGYIHLNGTSIHNKPLITSGYYTNEDDMKTMIAALRHQVSYVNSTSYSQRHAKFIRTEFKLCDAFEFDSDEYWKCYISYQAGAYHIAGTCKMGPTSDSEAVVDDRLRVRGVDGLRVIDASIMPYIISGNPMASVIMIGEKGAAMVIEDNS